MRHHHNCHHEHNEDKGFWFGILLGGFVGALIALLTTPRTGKQNQAILKKEGTKIYKKAQKVLKDKNIEEVFSELRQKVKKAAK